MSMNVLKKPIITEKSLMLANTHNVYTFEVDRLATKDAIKQAIKDTYKVEVIDVNTTTTNPSTRKTGRRRLTMNVAPVKKALVALKAGSTIEVFDIYNEQK
jgi:large subunit ribosomal protein L23